MITLDALQPRLRHLKLSGMRDAIGPRAEEARTRGLDPLEFLALLLDDELARREADGLARRIRKARFDELCDLRDFDFSYNPEIPKARIWELASGRFIAEHAAVVLCGPTGVGKSFVAQALGVAACRQQHSVLFAKTSAFLGDLAGGRADGSYQLRLRRYLSPRVLSQRVAVRMLEKRGYRVDGGANGREAREALARVPYDLLLMDCQMPEMDGYAVAAEIRQREHAHGGRRTSIIAIIANAMAGDDQACLAAGMDAYIAKPVTRAHLDAVLAQWHRGATPEVSDVARPDASGRAEASSHATREQHDDQTDDGALLKARNGHPAPGASIGTTSYDLGDERLRLTNASAAVEVTRWLSL
jgi:CheY-like chemotaxis protein